MPSTPAPDLNVTFYDDLQPIATAGLYTVTVDHRLEKDGERIDDDEFPLPHVEDQYEIKAAQFVLAPTSIHASYPPAGASDTYTRVLPHITLNRAVLPWERQLKGASARIPQREPWLALLVFAAGEVEEDPEATGEATDRTVHDLLHPHDHPATFGPRITEPTEADSLCRTIDVPKEIFHAVVPRQDELRYLAHVRDVHTAAHRRRDGEVITEGEYSVVAANRFPRGPGSYAVHLVSLEGYLGFLDPDSLPTETRRVRLCSLFSWSFTNDPAGSLNPADLLTNLVRPGLAADEHDDSNRERLALRQPVPEGQGSTPEQRYARLRLHRGYSPVPFRTLSGEQTYAWYRGPFTPLSAPEIPEPPTSGPYTTADHALIYDQEYGIFDVSYAVAWTLGRTIALADPDYSAEVAGARRELANLSATLSALSTDATRALRDPAAPAGASALEALAAPGFRAALTQSLRAPLARSAPPPPAARAARMDARALMSSPRTFQMLAATAEARTPSMARWLELLGLLRGVPFNQLVPDPRMLPGESLRAFRVDKGWIRALVRGAAEVGAHTSVDRDLHPLLYARAFHAAEDGSDDDGLPGAGMLMNSELVHAWPQFDILATAGGEPVEELRRDHLAPDVLLVLWDKVPDRIAIREPGQGVHFGIGASNRISLRYLSGPLIGKPIEPDDTEHPRQFPAEGAPDLFQAFLRRARSGREADVLNLRGTDGLIQKLGDFLALPDDLAPGQFALELVNAPLEQLLLPVAG